jgi:excisionase family DNA binding protein
VSTPILNFGEQAMLDKARSAHLAFPLMTVKEAAEYLGVTVRTIRRWQAVGKMGERVKHGRWVMYRKV